MSFGKGNNTTTQTTGPNPAAAAAYNDLLTRANTVSQTPYTPYTGELVAGVNQQQNLGIGNINANAGFAQPYINQAATYANQAAAPITASEIAQYQSPYTQQVVNATQAQFANQNAQQQSQLTGNAAAQGALGGDRVGVAQAILAGQQALGEAPTIANLENTGFQNAQQMALAQRQNLGNAAYSLGNLGVAGQGAALQGAGAQVGAGTLEQQTQQALDAARLQQFYQQQAYPFQTTQWLAGIDTGVGSQMGGTSTTTPPPPNPWNTAAGLGIAALGLFAKDGGRIHRDTGGGLGGTPWGGASGWVPTINITGGSGAPKPPTVGGQAAASPFGNIGADTNAFKGARNLWNRYGDSGPLNIGTDLGLSYSPDGIGALQDIGSAPAVADLGAFYRDGGAVKHFEDGGLALAGYGTGAILPFDDRWAPVPQAVKEGTFDPQGENSTAFADSPPIATSYGPKAVPTISVRRPTSIGDADVPPEILTGTSRPDVSEDAGVLAYGPGAANLAAARPSEGLSSAPQASPGFLSRLGSALSNPDINRSLMAAGFAMMASKSPFVGQAIGEAGLAGMNTYSGIQEEKRKEQKTQADIEHGRAQLAQAAKLAQDRINQEDKKLAAEQEHWKAQLQETHQHNQMALRAPVNLGADPRTGLPIMALPRQNKDGGLDYYMIGPNGQISDTPIGAPTTPSPLSAPGPTSALPSSPANAQQPVRTAALEVGTATDAPKPGEGLVQYNTRLAQAPGGVDYGNADAAPYIEKGMDVPEPAPLAGRTAQALKTDAEYYLETGKLPPVVRGNSPVAMVQQRYQTAVKNYAGALAQSRGMSPQEVAEAWRTAPGMLRFILGADGRSTVSLGTAVRHLDTMRQLVDAWKEGSTIGDWRTWNRVTSGVRREFGDTAVSNLESAAKIIGPEIIKAIGVAGAGGEREREAVERIYSPGSTPDQIIGAIGTVQSLLGGQLEGRERQAINAGVSHERFKSLIGDRPYELLSHTEKGGGTQAAPAAAKPTWDAWSAKAKQANPNATEQQLRDYYNKKYGP